MVLKICRLRDPEDIKAIIKFCPDMMGFDFCRTRVSYMGECDESILRDIPPTIRRIGVFGDDPPVVIASIAGRFMLNSVQLDGHTTPSECEMLASEGLEVIKSIYIARQDDFEKTIQYEGVCDKFIFKLSTTLSYSILDHYSGSTPFLLSIKMDNIEIPTIDNRRFIGFDTANSCEKEPAKKNIELLKQLVLKIKAVANN